MVSVYFSYNNQWLELRQLSDLSFFHVLEHSYKLIHSAADNLKCPQCGDSSRIKMGLVHKNGQVSCQVLDCCHPELFRILNESLPADLRVRSFRPDLLKAATFLLTTA